jgi:hypothetical protein
VGTRQAAMALKTLHFLSHKSPLLDSKGSEDPTFKFNLLVGSKQYASRNNSRNILEIILRQAQLFINPIHVIKSCTTTSLAKGSKIPISMNIF